MRWSEGEFQNFQARRPQKERKLGRSRARTSSGRVEKVTRDGMVFDSKREADRWSDLCLMQKGGEISDLEHQRPFALVVNERLVCEYVADFVYTDREGKRHIEDAKGWRTDVYRLKKKLAAALGIIIEEV